MYEWDERKEFHFTYRSRLYWFHLDLEKYERAARELEGSDRQEDQLLSDKQRRDKALRQSSSVVRIANCNFQALYYMRNDVTRGLVLLPRGSTRHPGHQDNLHRLADNCRTGV
jgi:hypothetical protein